MIHINGFPQDFSQDDISIECPNETSKANGPIKNKAHGKDLNKCLKVGKKIEQKGSQIKLSHKNEYQLFISLVKDLIKDEYSSNDDFFSPEINKSCIEKLCTEAAKLKLRGGMETIETDLLIKLLTFLQSYVQEGCEIIFVSDLNNNEKESKYFTQKVTDAIYASLISLYVLTSHVNSKICVEDILEQILSFANNQVRNTLNPVFRSPKKGVNSKNKRKGSNEKLEKCFLFLSHNMNHIITLFIEILDLKRLTDSLILQISALGVSSFFTGIDALGLSSLRLLTNLFSKYEKHRRLLIDDILTAAAFHKNYSCFKLKMGNEISLLTALFLQLVQSSIQLPQTFTSNKKLLIDDLVEGKYNCLVNITFTLSRELINKAVVKSEDGKCREIFNNLIHDLIKIYNTPEWPIAEVMLLVLCNLLIHNLSNRASEAVLRLFSLDFIGLIVGHLRKSYLLLEKNLQNINDIIEKVANFESETNPEKNKGTLREGYNKLKIALEILFNFMNRNSNEDIAFSYAEQCHLIICFNDICNKILSIKSKKRSFLSNNDQSPTSNLNEDNLQDIKELLLKRIEMYESSKRDFYQHKNQEYTDSNDINLICIYLSSKRSLQQRFNLYLGCILKVLTENSVAMRTKAMKCLASIIEIDPTILSHKDINIAISQSFLDLSPLVREAGVDLIGKYILGQPNLILKYYDALIGRILDTGINVRRRVIRILMDISLGFPNFIKIPEICGRILQRINDEESVKALVLDFFLRIWFRPVREKPRLESDLLVDKVNKIILSLSSVNEFNIELFEKLFTSIFKAKESLELVTKASKQIIDSLIEMIIQLEMELNEKHQKMLGSCLTLLYMFSKVKPQLLISHATTLQPYLTMRYNKKMDNKILNYVIKTLEQIIPIIDHPSEVFMAHLEEDCVKLIMSQDPTIVSSSVSCLGTIIKEITKNYTLVRDFFNKCYDVIRKTVMPLESKGSMEVPTNTNLSLNRSLFVTGLLIQHFDFEEAVFTENLLPKITKEEVIRNMYSLLNSNSQLYVLKALGFISIRYSNIFLNEELKGFYVQNLTDEKSHSTIKIQILNNIENYLTEDDKRWAAQDEKWAKLSKMENLKEINDSNLGMASTVVQNYLNTILESAIHSNQSVRNAAIKVIQIILNQGLVHPLQIVPYLIALSTDEDKIVRNNVEKHIQHIERKYPGYSHTKGLSGIQLSFYFQKTIKGDVLVRGYRLYGNEKTPRALNSFLYSILKTKQQKRSLIMSLIRNIEERAKNNLPYALYLADHLAYFPYRVQDELLFLIYQIDIMLSVCGMNMVEMFQENLIPKNQDEFQSEADNEDDEEESMESLIDRFPKNITPLEQSINAAQGSLLLGLLKQFIMGAFGITNDRLTKYSPSDSSKLYDKQINRKSEVSSFNPSVVIQKVTTCKQNHESLIEQYLLLKRLINNLDPDDFFQKNVKSQTFSETIVSNSENCDKDHDYMGNVRNNSEVIINIQNNRKVKKLFNQESTSELPFKKIKRRI